MKERGMTRGIRHLTAKGFGRERSLKVGKFRRQEPGAKFGRKKWSTEKKGQLLR